MKRFAQISKKIREIMDILSRQGGPENEQDAMFSKKHLGPQACASCEKGLVNMYGQQADFHVWKKLPFRDTNERIARFGQGFSKILSHMRTSDLYTGSGSPVRNQHMSSIDCTRQTANARVHNLSTEPTESPTKYSHKTAAKTTSGFYRENPRTSSGGVTQNRGPIYATSATGPESSIDEVNIGMPHNKTHSKIKNQRVR